MNEALQAILEKTLTGIDASVSFLSAQLPDVIQQLLWWKFTEHLTYFIIGLLIIIGYVVGVVKVYRRVYDEEYKAMVALTSLFFGVLVSLLCVCILNLTWLQILIAPKVYLIEYAASLVKGH